MTATFRYKITVIGDGSVGKTSLINRFVSNKFQESYQETVGIDMFNHDLVIDEKEIVEISLLIYDLGGQQYWKSLRSSFYQQSRGLILVFDVNNPESFHSLADWYKEAIENIGYTVPTIILGNKSDLEKKVSNKLLNSPFIKNLSPEIYFTSAKTGNMVNKAFKEISTQIYRRYNS